jgi:hypothetical protein
MSIKDGKIALLNYNNFVVTIPTETRTYVLEPAQDDNNPTIINVTFGDMEYINSHSNAFRTGLIFFKKEDQEEVYKSLSIYDWEDILSNCKIRETILNPTMEGLQKFIDVNDVVTFERIRGIMNVMLNSNSYDISNRVIKLINERYKELRRNVVNSQIVIQSKDTKTPKNENQEVADLKAQLAKMQEMMTQMLAMQNKQIDEDGINNEPESPENTEVKTDKKVGRPSTKK